MKAQLIRRIGLIISALSLLACFRVESTPAKTFVSSRGEFYFVYPEDWEQVDYNTVDYYLNAGAADSQAFDYEAAFAPASSRPFHSGDYFILTFDAVGDLTDTQIDSVVADFSQGIEEAVSYVATGDFLTDPKSRTINYDSTHRLLAFLSDVSSQGEVIRKNLWVMKFCKKGIANFYFYSPVSAFDQSKEVFRSVISSISTENVQSALPRETLKLADVETDAGDSGIIIVTLIIIAVIIVLLIVVIGLRRKTSSKT